MVSFTKLFIYLTDELFLFNKLYIYPIIYVFNGELISFSVLLNFSFQSSRFSTWFLVSSRKFFYKNKLFQRLNILLRKGFLI